MDGTETHFKHLVGTLGERRLPAGPRPWFARASRVFAMSAVSADRKLDNHAVRRAEGVAILHQPKKLSWAAFLPYNRGLPGQFAPTNVKRSKTPMSPIRRREFVSSLAAAGAAAVCGLLPGAESLADDCRLFAGANMKSRGCWSATTRSKASRTPAPALDQQMREWFSEKGRDVQLRPLSAVGHQYLPDGRSDLWNRCCGGSMLPAAKCNGSAPSTRSGAQGPRGTRTHLTMHPKPIGLQQRGQTTDDLLAAGKLDSVGET